MNEGRQRYSTDDSVASSSARRPIIATVTLLLLLGLFFKAGFWQLDRADEKRGVLERFAIASADDYLTSLVSDGDAELLRFRSFRLTGRYISDQQILLDNMTDGGSNGYQVLTPFATAGGTVLVNRGWLPADADRAVLPYIAVGEEPRTVIARLNNFPAPGVRLDGPAESGSDWPRRLLFPTATQLQAALGVELPAYQLQLAADQPDGYLRKWQAADSGPEKHLGYAFQWFSFAVLACIFYLLLMYQWLKTRRKHSTG